MKNKTCGECRYHKNNRCMLPCHTINHPAENSACHRFEVKTPLTNGDDELMAFKKKHKCDCCIYIRNGNCTEPVDRKDRCADGLKQWLNAPAESEGKYE